MKTLSLVVSSVILLCACGDRVQGLGGARTDTAPYAGTGVTAFTAPGWKPGDKTSWEQELKTRGQYGQNDYTRTN
jgi:hypothetical protein